MSIGEIAGLIAALAFVALVVFIIINLKKVANVIGELENTVKEVNQTISIVTKDVNNLSVEVEGLLNKTNMLVDDVNGKLSMTDPLFNAIGDIGVSVSDVNQTSRNLAASLVSKNLRKHTAPTNLQKLSRAALALRKGRKEKASGHVQEVKVEVEEPQLSNIKVYD
ncbi:DUF948 domain-containing protein [Atopobacter phocae]|uniref:DUF948 domain-containing protein n=1 Tax=Atopobacter phocae TaxID=136492 RepID=UPI00046E8B54|nr:DUF948 domain-containing protein [Atopobacter phocae]